MYFYGWFSHPAILDRHTGYDWEEKTGDTATGTADVIMDILMRQLGSGLHHVKRFKTDNGSNLKGGVIKEI